MHPIFETILTRLDDFCEEERIAWVIRGVKRLSKIHEIEVIQNWRSHLQKKHTEKRTNDLLELLRRQLREMLVSPNEDLALAGAAYEALLLLAEYKPINKEDPISRMEIEEDDRVCISTGLQYSLFGLSNWHDVRAPRRWTAESLENKWLLDPLTNERFPVREARHIFQIADERGVAFQSMHFMYEVNEHRMSIEQYESLGLSYRIALVDSSQEAISFIEEYELKCVIRKVVVVSCCS